MKRSIHDSRFTIHAFRALCLPLGFCLALSSAAAQEWKPTRNIDIIVSSGAGGAADREARETQRFLQKLPGMPAIAVTNRPGGGGTIAWTFVAQRPGDAHTISTLNVALLTNQVLGSAKIGYRDLTPLAILMREYIAVWTRTASPIGSAKELIARLKQDPSSVSFGLSPALGNQNHIVLGMLAKAAGIDPKALKIVVYSSGGQGMTAALGGHVEVWAGTLGGALARSQKGGGVRVLGVSAEQRPAGPAAQLPTFREQGIDVVYSAFRGFQGPPGLTAAQRAFWDQAFATIVQSEEWKEVELKHAWGSGHLDSAATLKFLDGEYQMLEKILAELGVIK
jgi:putative tricarboxylic transport membrane protein